MRTAITSDGALGRSSLDSLLERYVAWREECASVRDAYRLWTESDRGSRESAFAGYVAALDREEHAAGAYAEQVE
ncbi:MAG TPA: hypothetical protein VG388_00900, partial [Solirubrobacteraceae bacterium]|nr:hypothetical protein [Solirubrobacteraceae bacterium]